MPTAANLRSIESYRRTVAGYDAMPWHCVRDISRTPAALDNLISQVRPGTRLAIAGIRFFPWWLTPLNRLACRLERFECEAAQWGMGHLGSRVVKEDAC